MLTLLTVLCGLFYAAALVLTILGALKASFRPAWLGGACFAAALACALVLGLDGIRILLASLVLLCASQAGRRHGREL